ncbi:MAG: 50S ribosomal protein L23 [Gemmataceae bacterium]
MPPVQQEKRGPDLEPHQIVLRPLITEKSTYQSRRLNMYRFEVNLWATKEQIRHAVEQLFNVRVTKVRTQTRVGKTRRFRGRLGRLSHWKIAIVTLHPEDHLELI